MIKWSIILLPTISPIGRISFRKARIITKGRPTISAIGKILIRQIDFDRALINFFAINFRQVQPTSWIQLIVSCNDKEIFDSQNRKCAISTFSHLFEVYIFVIYTKKIALAVISRGLSTFFMFCPQNMNKF